MSLSHDAEARKDAASDPRATFVYDRLLEATIGSLIASHIVRRCDVLTRAYLGDVFEAVTADLIEAGVVREVTVRGRIALMLILDRDEAITSLYALSRRPLASGAQGGAA